MATQMMMVLGDSKLTNQASIQLAVAQCRVTAKRFNTHFAICACGLYMKQS